jgi:hypothetical protein
MLKLGFRVKELIGGLDWWKRDGHKRYNGHVDPYQVSVLQVFILSPISKGNRLSNAGHPGFARFNVSKAAPAA